MNKKILYIFCYDEKKILVSILKKKLLVIFGEVKVKVRYYFTANNLFYKYIKKKDFFFYIL